MSAADTKAIGVAKAAQAASDAVSAHVSSYAREQLLGRLRALGQPGNDDYLAGYGDAISDAIGQVDGFTASTFEFLEYEDWLAVMKENAWKQKHKRDGTEQGWE